MDEHRFHTPAPVELEIKVPVGDIEVETVDGDETTIVLDGNEKLMEMTEVRQEGDRVVVELRGKKPFGITISIGDFNFGGGGLHIRARVPHSSSASVTTASADAKLRGRYASLTAKSASGDLVVDGEIDGDVDLKTVSGDVRMARVGGDLHGSSVSGDVTADAVDGSVELKSVSGDVRFGSVRQGTLIVQSVSGDIEVGVAAGTNLDVDAGSVSGDLSSEVPLGSEPGGAEDGPTLVVRGKTISGDFRVFRAA